MENQKAQVTQVILSLMFPSSLLLEPEGVNTEHQIKNHKNSGKMQREGRKYFLLEKEGPHINIAVGPTETHWHVVDPDSLVRLTPNTQSDGCWELESWNGHNGILTLKQVRW